MIDAAARTRLTALLADRALSGLLVVLNPPGEETRLVGGAIRNALLGEAVADIDLVTTLMPDETSQRAIAAGWQAIPTGIEHGTVTLVKQGRSFEVTTLREDIETDGRRAVVRFGRDFTHDAARRDFTINALSMGRDGIVRDYFDGLSDLGARKVRFIGDPDQRIREDYLRGLRFFRFTAAYGEGLDKAGLAAVVRQRAGFAELSRERVRQEFLKLLMARRAVDVIAEAERYGLASEILGFQADTVGLAVAVHVAESVGYTLDGMARLTMLAGVHAGDAASVWQERLRLSNDEVKALHRLDRAATGQESSPRALRYHYGDEAIPALILRVAGQRDLAEMLTDRIDVAKLSVPDFLISGTDVLASGIKPGPQVGKILLATETQWITADFPPQREVQLNLLKTQLKTLD